MHIRKATDRDADAIWRIFQQVVKRGDSFPFAPDISRNDGLGFWMHPKHHVYVAEEDGAILGSYYIKDNQPDLGSHVANAGFMVDEAARGKGVGLALGHHAVEEAKRLEYQAMQFNLVVATNETAVRLWKQIGMEIVGTLPGAFHHKDHGLVDAYVMYRTL